VRKVRDWIGYVLIRFGLKVLPASRTKEELYIVFELWKGDDDA